MNRTIRTLTFAALLAGASAAAFAVPAKQGPINVTQPDGTPLTIRIQGNGLSHFTYTDDGYLLVGIPEEGYEYARIGANGEIEASGIRARNLDMRSASDLAFLKTVSHQATLQAVEKADMAAKADRLAREEKLRNSNPRKAVSNGAVLSRGLIHDNFPTKGEIRSLVILVEFENATFDSKNLPEYHYSQYGDGTAHTYFNDMLNKDDFDAFNSQFNWKGSARQWFMENSKDADGKSQFIPTFDVYGPVKLGKRISYYGKNEYNQEPNAYKMIVDACKILDETTDINFADYDYDGDGDVDNVFVFYAGYGEADGGAAETVFPHADHISYFERVVLDGVRLDYYACANETVYAARYPDGIGTFVHEFGHVLGLPDLYPSMGYGVGAYTPLKYDIMDQGVYNNCKRTPPYYSAYERYALGWLEPREFCTEEEIDLEPLHSSLQAYIVKTDDPYEYFMVERRKKEGWDSYIPGEGVLIWHIDYDKQIFDTNKCNNLIDHQYVDLIEANEIEDIYYADGHPFGAASGVTSYSFRGWSGKDTGVSISNIKEEGDKLTFKAINPNGPVVGIENIDADIDASIAEAGYYSLQGIKVENPAKGDILIQVANGKARKVKF